MIPLSTTISYYKRKEVQEEIIKAAKDREIAVKFDESFGQRPDALNNKADILELAKQKATSFHCSEELWKNPLQLNPNMKRHEMDSLRIGWDLVLDIDCMIFEYSKVAADLIMKALEFYDIKSVSCKFSGNKGFHIGVPFESFPSKIKSHEVRNMFPDAPRKIALYLKSMILEHFGQRILKIENNDFSRILEKTGKKSSEVIYEEKGKKKFNPESILQMDTLLISSRHLFRMPYSLHEKSGLVSLPIDPKKVLDFNKDMAVPENIKISKAGFLERKNVLMGEATKLLTQALDFSLVIEDADKNPKQDYEIQSALPEQFFPPCIKLISNGLSDGRKRALFILINYLTSIGWDYDKIESYLREWNKKNTEQLRDVYIVGQLRYHKTQKKKILPPNCINMMYYVDIGVCKPDNLCAKIKNPVNYSQRKAMFMNKVQEKAVKQ